MKKLLIGFLTLVTTAAFGQVRRGNDIVLKTQFGAYGGLSVANQWGGGGDYDNGLAGGIAGIQVAFPISWGWYVQPEVTYSNMGTSFYYNGGKDDYNGNVNLHMNYVSIPVLFKWELPFTGFGVLFGPQYGYLLNAHQVATGYDRDNYGRENVLAEGYWHRSDFSGVVGLEYYFPNNEYYKGPKFGISVRYQFGFINVSNGATYDGSTITNNAFFLTGGIRF